MVELSASGKTQQQSYSVGVVSLCIIARNEEAYLPTLLDDVLAQTFPHKRIEVVLVDGASVDGTRSVMERFAREKRDQFYDVVVLDNPKMIQPAGWNVAIGGSGGDVVIRIDAHAAIPENFVEQNVRVLESGEEICGGVRPTLVKDATAWRRVLHLAEESAFGSSVAPYRREAAARYVASLFHGAYRRRVFNEVGGFDERLCRTEDNEMHYRIRKQGFRICLSPLIISHQFIRCTLRGMLKQKYSNGYWIGRTLYVEPRCFEVYHFVPLLFVLALITGIVLAFCGIAIPLIALIGVYLLVDIALSAKAMVESRSFNGFALLLPLIFAAIHLFYGIGTFIGIISGAAFKLLGKQWFE